jgi:hypothetical protein
MNKRKAAIGSVMTALVSLLAAWAFGMIGGTDPAVAKLQELGKQAFDDKLPEAQRDQFRDQFRQQMQGLTDDQRRAFFDANRDQWQARGQQRMNEFFQLSKADQNKRLDEIINRMTQPRAQGQNAGRNGNGQAGGGRGGPGGRNMTEAQREERSKRRLDSTSPQLRAQFSEFRKRLDQRAAERGVKLPSGGWPGGGRG